MADLGGDFRPRYAPPGMANTQNIEGGQNVPMSSEDLARLSMLMPAGPTMGAAALGYGTARLGGRLAAGSRAAYKDLPIWGRGLMNGGGAAYMGRMQSVGAFDGDPNMDAEAQRGYDQPDMRLLAQELMKGGGR